MLASEMLEIVNKNDKRKEAVENKIKSLENKIVEYAEKGKRNCIVSFYDYSNGYDLEVEIKDHFKKNGFTFKLVTDDVCGGVLQSPYWIICW